MNTDPLCYRLRHQPGTAICRDHSGELDPSHCYIHAVDEPMERVYLCCFECGHVYPSARSLWWANLRTTWRLRDLDKRFKPPPEQIKVMTEAFGINERQLLGARGPTWWRNLRSLIRAGLRRPDRVRFCAVCSHDF